MGRQLTMAINKNRSDQIHDNATDFAVRRDREARRAYARRPKKIGDVVAQLIAKRGYGRIEANEELAAAWNAAAGQSLASASHVGRIRRGTLEVTVANSTHMQEFSFQKHRILADLQRSLPRAGIRNLRFRVGKVN